MTVTFSIVKRNKAGNVGLEKIVCEDVCKFEIDDAKSTIYIEYNTKNAEEFPLSFLEDKNDPESWVEWVVTNIQCERVAMTVDFTK